MNVENWSDVTVTNFHIIVLHIAVKIWHLSPEYMIVGFDTFDVKHSM